MLKKMAATPLKKINTVKIKGSYSAAGMKFGIVVSEFNEFFTERLVEGASDTLVRLGAKPKDITVAYVPGAFEIPLTAERLLKRKKLDAVITLAVVVRGKTKHFDQVVLETARGVRELSQKSGIPVILGMIPADSVEDAAERMGIKHTAKARDWALSAVEMASVLKKIDGKKS